MSIVVQNKNINLRSFTPNVKQNKSQLNEQPDNWGVKRALQQPDAPKPARGQESQIFDHYPSRKALRLISISPNISRYKKEFLSVCILLYAHIRMYKAGYIYISQAMAIMCELTKGDSVLHKVVRLQIRATHGCDCVLN